MEYNKFLDPKSDSLRAAFLVGTLKQDEFSHTEVLSGLLAENLKPYNVDSEIIRLVDFNIKPGVERDMGPGDDWPKLLDKILKADIIVFATPIWWGIQSSVIQRAIERMDELNDELLETGKSELANKIGGIVITGAEDGAQHVIGNLSNFMIWNGMTLPPACSLSYLGDFSKQTKDSLLEEFRNQKSTASMAKTMARNLVFFARLLKENNMPQDEGGVLQDIAPGAVGMRGDQ